MKTDLKSFQQKIDYKFNNEELLLTALTHSSYANECGGAFNERLEFLGDSVLGFISAEFFFSNRKSVPEGELTKLRAATVCEKSLFGFAKEIDLGSYIRLGKGEMNTGGRERPSILSDAFEAIIAAIYLDGGMEEAKKFVLRFLKEAQSHKNDSAFKDYKTVLQEIIQRNPEERLEYVLVGESGPAHDKIFEVEIHLNSNCIGKGSGHSKKLAEQAAAGEALKLMGIE
ncbi:MAG: ribonuclease III [Clostridia bacterium]|nr:ribonuclease III [Clostridia bacterium]MBR4050755.1 ribonuclease III [Clostridia bacterium]MBR6635179.1 ribonuclease III [Clostridia bacterium]